LDLNYHLDFEIWNLASEIATPPTSRGSQ